MRQAHLAVASLKMKSSQQFKDTMQFKDTAPKPMAGVPLPTHAAGAPAGGYTRTMLLEKRKQDKMAMEQTARDSFVQTTGTSMW